MKKLILLILLPFLLSAQYGSEMLDDPMCEGNGTAIWANKDTPTYNDSSSAQIHGGSYSRKFTTDAANEGIKQVFTTITSEGYRIIAWVYPDDQTYLRIMVRRGSDAGATIYDNSSLPELNQDTWNYTVGNYTEVAGGSNAELRFQSTAVGNGSWFIDDVSMRKKIDTLYTDPLMADETDIDSTKTLTEAFVTRGSHSSGFFITSTGTYSESITIDSSFTKWEASGTATVTSVDFNSVTCTVDLANLTITTKLNNENVTYLNDYIYNGYKDYKINTNYGGYK